MNPHSQPTKAPTKKETGAPQQKPTAKKDVPKDLPTPDRAATAHDGDVDDDSIAENEGTYQRPADPAPSGRKIDNNTMSDQEGTKRSP